MMAGAIVDSFCSHGPFHCPVRDRQVFRPDGMGGHLIFGQAFLEHVHEKGFSFRPARMRLAPDCPVKKVGAGGWQRLAIVEVFQILDEDSGAGTVQDDMVEGQEQDPAVGSRYQQAEAEEGALFQVIGPAQLLDPVFDLFRSAFKAEEVHRDLVMNHMAELAIMYGIGRAEDTVTGHQCLECFFPTIRINPPLE